MIVVAEWRMKKEEEKRQKFHDALLKMPYPSPPSPIPHQEDEDKEEENKLIDRLNEETENEKEYSSPSSGDDGGGGGNGGGEKLTRAQRKRLRKRKLKEAASRRRKIIGPLLPSSGDENGNDVNVEVVADVPESVRQNATTNFPGEHASCSKQKKLKQRRKSKKSGGDQKGNLSNLRCAG